MQFAHNPATNEICEEMSQMRTELGLVLKHVTGGVEKVNAVNYLSKPPPVTDEYYYEEDSYAVNKQTRGFPTKRPRLQSGELESESRKSRSELW